MTMHPVQPRPNPIQDELQHPVHPVYMDGVGVHGVWGGTHAPSLSPLCPPRRPPPRHTQTCAVPRSPTLPIRQQATK
jgi:hypothetical protein